MTLHLTRTAAAAALVLCSLGAHASVVATNTDYAKFSTVLTATRPLAVTAHGTIRDVDLTVDFAKCDDPGTNASGQCAGIGKPFNNEIVFRLQGPDGQWVSLVERNTYTSATPGPGLGRIQLTFDDEAATRAGGVLAPGSFQPLQPLSAFDGKDLFGTWNLFLQDTGAGDPLEFFGATLDIDYDSSQVPEPATAAIIGLGLAGMAALRRRVRN
jgi:hypothetical protein